MKSLTLSFHFLQRFPPPSSYTPLPYLRSMPPTLSSSTPSPLTLATNALFTTRSIMQIVACDRNMERETNYEINENLERTLLWLSNVMEKVSLPQSYRRLDRWTLSGFKRFK